MAYVPLFRLNFKYIQKQMKHSSFAVAMNTYYLKGENNLVFPNNEGNYQSAENMMKRRFLPALNRAGIDRIRFHDLRHTYASLLLANGAPMKYVQHQLGHSSITMTMDLYTHLSPEVNDKCVNLLNSIVNQTIEPQEVQRFGT